MRPESARARSDTGSVDVEAAPGRIREAWRGTGIGFLSFSPAPWMSDEELETIATRVVRCTAQEIARFVRLAELSPELLALALRLVRGHVQELNGGVCDCTHCKQANVLLAKVEGGNNETSDQC